MGLSPSVQLADAEFGTVSVVGGLSYGDSFPQSPTHAWLASRHWNVHIIRQLKPDARVFLDGSSSIHRLPLACPAV